MIKVLVVDDHALSREGATAVINAQLDMKVVAEAANGIEAIKVAGEFHPDVVLMDLNMPEMDGTEATRCLLKKLPETKVLILTISEKDDSLFGAIKAGAMGYLLKGADPEELVRAITHVAQGCVVISSHMAPKILSDTVTNLKPEQELGLSQREIEVMDLVGRGLSDKQISEKLFISLNTVKTHMKNILSKLHAKNRTEAVLFGFKTETAQKDSGS